MQIISIIEQTHITEDRSDTRKRYIRGITEIVFSCRNRLTCWTKPSNCDAFCHRWMQEETTGPITSLHDDRRIMRMTVMDGAATAQTITHQVQSVRYPLVPFDAVYRSVGCLKGIGFQCRTTLGRISSTMNSLRYISELLKPLHSALAISHISTG
ncbi:hypothetical protein TNCV_1592201 [Trichonephila clavipes]|nr:hypothetical protein TNCV_1592201 [Trichonephila clavipes]